MRKTRLVILPGARCLHQLGFLLLFLACPTIAFKGQENRDIQPFSRLLILKQNWIPSNTGKGIGCEGNFERVDVRFGIWNSDNGHGNFCHNNNNTENYLNASTDQQHFKIFEKKSDPLYVSWFQKDALRVNSRSLQRQVRSLAEVKRIRSDNTRRINLDTRRDSLSRRFSSSHFEKRAENGRIQTFTRIQPVQERRERRNSVDSVGLRTNSFVQNKIREIDSTNSRRITARQDSRVQNANNRFRSENSRRLDLAQRRNDRLMNSLTITTPIEKRDSLNRRYARYMRENSENASLRKNTVQREVRQISRDTMERMSDDKRIITRRDSRIFLRENTMQKRFLIQDSPLARTLAERNSESREKISENRRSRQRISENRRSQQRISENRRSQQRISLGSENGRISVRENSIVRSNRNDEDRKTLERQISSYGLMRRKTEFRTLAREKRSVDSMDRNSLRQLSQQRIRLSRVNSMERSFNRENPSIDSSRGNSNNRNYLMRDNTFSRSEPRNLEGRRTLIRESKFRRSLARDEPLLRNSEGRRTLDRELPLTYTLGRNSENRRTDVRDDTLRRSLQRNSMEKRNADQESPSVNSVRRDLEYRRSVRRSASPSQSFRRISEERRFSDREVSSAYSSRRNSELTRTLSRSDSSSRLSQRDSERRTLDRESLSLNSAQRYSEYRRTDRDDSRFSSSQRIHLNRRSLTLEPVRINVHERRSAVRTDYSVRSAERNVDERRTNSRDTVSRESLQRNLENRRYSDRQGREIPLIRSERSRSSREASFRLNIRSSENSGTLRRENVLIQSNGFSSRFRNERRTTSETSLVRENRLFSANERSDRRNNDLFGRTLVKMAEHRFDDRRFSVASQRAVERRTFNSGERNHYAMNNYFRNVDFNKFRRISDDSVRSFRISNRDEQMRRAVRDEPMNRVVSDERMRRVVRDEPMSRVVRDEPMRRVVRDEPMRRVVRDEPMRRVVRDETMRRVVRDEPMRRVVRDEPMRRVVRDERVTQRTVRNDRFVQKSLPAEFSFEITRNSNVNENLIRNVEKRSLRKSYRSDLRMTRRLTNSRENIRFDRKSTRITRKADLSDNTRFLSRSLEVTVLAERRNFRQIRQESSYDPSFTRLTENSSGKFINRHNNNRFQKIVNFRETKNYAFNSKKLDEQYIIQSWFNQLFESIKQAGKTLYEGSGKLISLEFINTPSMKGNGRILEDHQDDVNGLWNNKRHAENFDLPGAITGGILCASLYLNVQKREIY